jgi:hypothetical protein
MVSRLVMVLYVTEKHTTDETLADLCWQIRFCSLLIPSLSESFSPSLLCMLTISLVGLLSRPPCPSTTSGLLLRLKAALATSSTTTLSLTKRHKVTGTFPRSGSSRPSLCLVVPQKVLARTLRRVESNSSPLRRDSSSTAQRLRCTVHEMGMIEPYEFT